MEEENANKSNPREILERICTFAERLMLEKSKSCRWTSFKDNLCLRYRYDFGWGLVVYEMPSSGKVAWVVDPSSRKVLSLGETFIWKARTEENAFKAIN